jgi:hypothetical protein
MRGAVLHAPWDVRVEQREDPKIEQPTDAVIRLARRRRSSRRSAARSAADRVGAALASRAGSAIKWLTENRAMIRYGRNGRVGGCSERLPRSGSLVAAAVSGRGRAARPSVCAQHAQVVAVLEAKLSGRGRPS